MTALSVKSPMTFACSCPGCRRVVGTFQLGAGSVNVPAPGAICLCDQCAFISMFVPAMGGGLQLRPLRLDEWRVWLTNPISVQLRENWAAMINQLRHGEGMTR